MKYLVAVVGSSRPNSASSNESGGSRSSPVTISQSPTVALAQKADPGGSSNKKNSPLQSDEKKICNKSSVNKYAFLKLYNFQLNQ